MNVTTRKTRACTLDTLDEELKAAIRAHGARYELDDLEADILMCRETFSVLHEKGFLRYPDDRLRLWNIFSTNSISSGELLYRSRD